MNLAARFDALDDFLSAHAPVWRPRPFHDAANAWSRTAPELRAWLSRLDAATLEALDADPQALCAALSPFVDGIGAAIELARVDEALPRSDPRPDFMAPAPQTPAPEPLATADRAPAPPASTPCALPPPFAYPRGFAHDVPGRKWQQVAAFTEACADGALPYVDWCAGRGHLARALRARTGQPVTALDHDARLLAAGHRLARARRVDVAFRAIDALSGEAASLLARPVHLVVLHACGDLHLRAIDAGIAARVPALTVAPCCHHLSSAPHCLRSAHARRSRLQLLPRELLLATQETVTARQHRQRQSRQAGIYRLGFDALQRDVRGVDAFLPLPSAPRRLFRGDFAAFCAWAATCTGIHLPRELAPYLQRGAQLDDHVRRLSLLRHAFRRPLEVWLLLDRCLELAAHGYAVTLATFVPPSTTPRNLLLRARR